MKERIKAFCKDNEEILVTSAAGVIVSGLLYVGYQMGAHNYAIAAVHTDSLDNPQAICVHLRNGQTRSFTKPQA